MRRREIILAGGLLLCAAACNRVWSPSGSNHPGVGETQGHAGARGVGSIQERSGKSYLPLTVSGTPDRSIVPGQAFGVTIDLTAQAAARDVRVDLSFSELLKHMSGPVHNPLGDLAAGTATQLHVELLPVSAGKYEIRVHLSATDGSGGRGGMAKAIEFSSTEYRATKPEEADNYVENNAGAYTVLPGKTERKD